MYYETVVRTKIQKYYIVNLLQWYTDVVRTHTIFKYHHHQDTFNIFYFFLKDKR